jgi:hypothetical protein
LLLFSFFEKEKKLVQFEGYLHANEGET